MQWHSNHILSLCWHFAYDLVALFFSFLLQLECSPNLNNFVYLSPPISSVAARRNTVPLQAHAAESIWVAHKPKTKKRVHNVFYDNRGFPDQSDEYDYLLHSVDGGPVLRKLRHPAPDLEGPVDPSFLSVFNPDVHESQLREELDLSHLSPDVRD